jgi:hypothetical protein
VPVILDHGAEVLKFVFLLLLFYQRRHIERPNGGER